MNKGVISTYGPIAAVYLIALILVGKFSAGPDAPLWALFILIAVLLGWQQIQPKVNRAVSVVQTKAPTKSRGKSVPAQAADTAYEYWLFAMLIFQHGLSWSRYDDSTSSQVYKYKGIDLLKVTPYGLHVKVNANRWTKSTPNIFAVHKLLLNYCELIDTFQAAAPKPAQDKSQQQNSNGNNQNGNGQKPQSGNGNNNSQNNQNGAKQNQPQPAKTQP